MDARKSMQIGDTGIGNDFVNVLNGINSAVIRKKYGMGNIFYSVEPLETYEEYFPEEKYGIVVNDENRARVSEINRNIEKINSLLKEGSTDIEKYSDLIDNVRIKIYLSEVQEILLRTFQREYPRTEISEEELVDHALGLTDGNYELAVREVVDLEVGNFGRDMEECGFDSCVFDVSDSQDRVMYIKSMAETLKHHDTVYMTYEYNCPGMKIMPENGT